MTVVRMLWVGMAALLAAAFGAPAPAVAQDYPNQRVTMVVPFGAGTLIEGARLFAHSPDGLMPWRGRPAALKRGLVARTPPFAFAGDPE